MKITGLGACVFDTLIISESYPVEDTKRKAKEVFFSGGGPVGNALVIAEKLGADCSAVGLFGDDAAASYLLSDFAKYGVNIKDAVKIKNAKSFTSYIILSEKDKTRTILFDRGSVPDDPELLKTDKIAGSDALHLDGNYLNCAIKAAKIAKENGVKVSLDAGGLYDGIERLLPYADILIPSAEFVTGLTGEKDLVTAAKKTYEKYKPEVFVVTDGSRGGYYFTENGDLRKYDSVKVEAIDTNGAGDTFHGAFLAAYLSGKNIEDACDFAKKVAAYKCGKKGLREIDFKQFSLK